MQTQLCKKEAFTGRHLTRAGRPRATAAREGALEQRGADHWEEPVRMGPAPGEKGVLWRLQACSHAGLQLWGGRWCGRRQMQGRVNVAGAATARRRGPRHRRGVLTSAAHGEAELGGEQVGSRQGAGGGPRGTLGPRGLCACRRRAGSVHGSQGPGACLCAAKCGRRQSRQRVHPRAPRSGVETRAGKAAAAPWGPRCPARCRPRARPLRGPRWAGRAVH